MKLQEMYVGLKVVDSWYCGQVGVVKKVFKNTVHITWSGCGYNGDRDIYDNDHCKEFLFKF